MNYRSGEHKMATERNPENTRLRILKAAFKDLHRNGFQGLRIDNVLKETGLKKGALYHHFVSKQALGYAVLEELIQNFIVEQSITPLANFDNPLEGIMSTFTSVGTEWSDEFFHLGCPLFNLSQEMTPIDEGFRTRIKAFFTYWEDEYKKALKSGQDKGFIKKDLNLEEVARFIITSIEGAIGQAKIHQDRKAFFSCGNQLERYLGTLAC